MASVRVFGEPLSYRNLERRIFPECRWTVILRHIHEIILALRYVSPLPSPFDHHHVHHAFHPKEIVKKT